MLSRPHGFMLYGKMGADIFSSSGLVYPNMKFSLRLIRARTNFNMISTNTTLVLELLIVHFTLIVLLSRMIITGNECTCLSIFLWSSSIWKLLRRLSSFLPHRTSSFKKTFSEGSSSSDCYCNEYKICTRWIIHWKSVLVSAVWSQIKSNTQKVSQS